MNAVRHTPAERLICSVLHQQPSMTAVELATECGLNRQYILRLLRVLQLTGAVTRSTDGRYTLSTTEEAQ